MVVKECLKQEEVRVVKNSLLYSLAFMLSKANRLSRSEIELIIKTGKSINSPFFSGKWSFPSIPARNLAKASFVVSKKVFPKAVVRNRVKRRAREAFRSVLSELKSVNVVFFMKKESLLAKTNDISLEFIKNLKK